MSHKWAKAQPNRPSSVRGNAPSVAESSIRLLRSWHRNWHPRRIHWFSFRRTANRVRLLYRQSRSSDLAKYRPMAIFNLAAEDRSIDDGTNFIDTNVAAVHQFLSATMVIALRSDERDAFRFIQTSISTTELRLLTPSLCRQARCSVPPLCEIPGIGALNSGGAMGDASAFPRGRDLSGPGWG
jgi:hypothetical protein